jgi:predicted 2-oxoglutarate/Fe(II)-dependent dioxygenase YbiX
MGALLPPLVLPSLTNPRYVVNSAAGRWVLLACIPAAAAAGGLEAALAPHRARFDDANAALFIASATPEDLTEGRLRDQLPGIRMLADPGGEAARLCGFDPASGGLLLLDPMLRVVQAAPLTEAAGLLAAFAALPPAPLHAGTEVPAPVLVLPRVLEPAFCRRLVALYEAQGGAPSGFMREIDGRTRLVQDPGHKRRSDLTIEDKELLDGLRARLATRLIPAIAQAFQFQATRVERYIVACYDAAEGGHFRAHRDNTTKGTAHRRFAVTINLNAEDFEGGELHFPEFGPRRYRAPTGGAVVFSCSLLHEATPVTRGRRYAFLPFLYDEAAAKVREANQKFLERG